MSSADRAPGLSSGPRRAAASGSSRPGDLAARVRRAQPELHARLEHRTEFLDLVREMNSTLHPDQIAALLVRRVAGWVPAACWVVAAFDGTGRVTVLAEQGLEPNMKPVVDRAADWIL